MKHARAWFAALATAAVLTTAAATAGPGLRVTVAGARGRVARNQPLKLTSQLHWRGPKADMSYAWESLAGPALPYSIDRTGPTLTIPAAELDSGEYKIRLRVRAEWQDPDMDPSSQSVEATSDVAFTVNTPPFGGSCQVETQWVGSAFAQLSIYAKGWQDPDDKQLQYRYSVTRNGKKQLLQNWRPLKQHAATVPAKRGDTLVVLCEVRDRVGDDVSASSDPIKRP